MKLYRYIIVVVSLFNMGCANKNGERNDRVKRPNIIFILADDLGYMDVQAYAAHTLDVDKHQMFYETPNLDRLSKNGISFSRAYATQLCSPTRAGLLTGKYAARLGFTTAAGPEPTYFNQNIPAPEGSYIHDVLYHSDPIKGEQAWRNGSSNTAVPTGTPYDSEWDEITIAEALPDYDAAFIGKWHIGGFGAKGYQPSNNGFEELAYWDAPGSPYFNWKQEWSGYFGESESSYLRNLEKPERAKSDFVTGNTGVETHQEYLTDDLTEQAVNYIRQKASGEKPFFLYFCHFAVHGPWEGKPKDIAYFNEKPTKGWNGHNNPTYASMIRSLDSSVGRILDVLEEMDLEDNTLVVFMSDNGGIDSKIIPKGSVTDNAPFKGGKACLTEGGVRVPLIFKWKDRIENGWSDVPVDYTDIMPTLVEVAGYDEEKLTKQYDWDGRSIASLFNDVGNKKNEYTKQTRYWHYPFNVIYNNPYDGLPLTPHSAIMVKDHKLIFDWYGRLSLFNIKEDPYEDHNLVNAMPEKAFDLFDDLYKWLDVNVEETYWPSLNDKYNANEEVRDTPFVNLIEKYEKGELRSYLQAKSEKK